jgi:hypothetical protein
LKVAYYNLPYGGEKKKKKLAIMKGSVADLNISVPDSDRQQRIKVI